jgi:hypothetical protein
VPQSVVNLALVAGLWFVLVAGCCNFWNKKPMNHNSSPSPTGSPTSTNAGDGSSISAVELYNEWKKDKDAAEARYKDKTLTVSGKIRLVRDTSIVINSGAKSDILGVQCVLADKDRGQASGLSEGQSITVEGRCVGRIGNVVLRPCTVK